MPINILSQETINKIAAGEVVERPLNAVKELVENSLDAFASSITIEIEQAGKKLIRISDNGCGMDKKDLELSIQRHATSKIVNYEDLSYISSMGFRGEALASIAAVSKFEMKTRKKGGQEGWKLTTDGGKSVNIIPSSSSDGTITEIKDLFFNTPVRQKFLKSDAVEKAKIISAVEETSLANPEVSFKLISDGRNVFSAVRTDGRIDRISDILTQDFAKTLISVKVEHLNASMEFYFTKQENVLTNKNFQYLFVNSRPVNFSKRTMHAVYSAFRESIPHDKHPGILIFINIEPSEIDVNISPTKREIKFAAENAIYDLIFKTIKNALFNQTHPEIKISVPASEKIFTPLKPNAVYEKFDKAVSDFRIKEPAAKSKYTVSKSYTPVQYASVFAKPEQTSFKEPSFSETNNNIKVIGQVFETYIIVEKGNEFFIFDQHASDERIRYEIYTEQINKKELKTQNLLFPENIEFSKSVSQIAKENIPIFNELGISVEQFGDNTFRITSYPALLGNVSIGQILKSIVEDIFQEKKPVIEKKRDKIIRAACRASVKAGDKISLNEAKVLINNLFKCKFPFTCPHGRPTAYKISLTEIEKFFKRK
jgi:DNA mismatch repair protein MutL